MPKKKYRKRKYDQNTVTRVKLPGDGEVLGYVIRMLGNSRLNIQCLDGHTRLCRIRGKLVRRMWIREADVVIVSPWEFQYEKRGDVVYRYKKTQARWLAKHGYIPEDFLE